MKADKSGLKNKVALIVFIIIIGLCVLLSSCGMLTELPPKMLLIGGNYKVYDKDTVTRCKILSCVNRSIYKLDSIRYMGYIPKDDTVLVKQIRTQDRTMYVISKW